MLHQHKKFWKESPNAIRVTQILNNPYAFSHLPFNIKNNENNPTVTYKLSKRKMQ